MEIKRAENKLIEKYPIIHSFIPLTFCRHFFDSLNHNGQSPPSFSSIQDAYFLNNEAKRYVAPIA